jgi:hypothetical protein
MQFESANPSVIKSIKQRDLFNAWQRARGKNRALPRTEDYQHDRIGDEMPDMMRFDVESSGNGARFLITQEGSRLTATYGSEHIEPGKRTNRYLDDAIGPERYARVVPSYSACVVRKRPTYSISMVQDPDGKDVFYERLLLPFGSADSVEQIVGSYKAISLEGGFKINNLMGLEPKAVPVSLVNAVIERDFVPVSAGHRASGDIIELG